MTSLCPERVSSDLVLVFSDCREWMSAKQLGYEFGGFRLDPLRRVLMVSDC
jgi:hypothetical protein